MRSSAPLVYIARRLLGTVVVVYLIVTVAFFLAHASPYDPIHALLGQRYNGANRARLRALYGLDRPVWDQYVSYLGGLIHGDLGYSDDSQTLGVPVWTILSSGVPVSLKLGGLALLVALLIGLPVGLISAWKQNSLLDHGAQSLMMILFAVPSFVSVPLCQLVLGAELKWLPVSGWGDAGLQGLKEMVLPVTLYAATLAGYFAKSFRSFLLEVLRQEYMLVARAKGLGRWNLAVHAVKNTLLPLVSIIGPSISYLVVGAFIIEYLFSIPGIGYITVISVTHSDYAVITGTTLVLAVAVSLVNLLTDLAYMLIDPRLRRP